MTEKTPTAIPPGATIKEQLEYRNMTQKEFAVRMDLSQKHVSHLINGTVQLTPEVAYRLEMVLGIPASFWNNLEAGYREKLVQIEHQTEMEREYEIVRQFPYQELAREGYVKETKDHKERVIQLRKFFEVSKMEVLMEMVFEKAGVPYQTTDRMIQLLVEAEKQKWDERIQLERALDEAENHAKADPTRLSHQEVFSSIRENLKGSADA